MSDGKIVVFGEVLFDKFFRKDQPEYSEQVLGGAPMNFAYHLSKNLEIPAVIVSAIGPDNTDGLSEIVLETLNREGMDISLLQRNPHPTGLVPVQLSDSGHTFKILTNRAFDYIVATSDVVAAAAQAPLIYYGTLAQRCPVSAGALREILNHAPDAIKFCDINLREECYTDESVRSSIERADIVKLNEDEIFKVLPMVTGNEVVTGDKNPREQGKLLFDAIQTEWGARELVVTLGSRGALAFSKDGELHYHPGFAVNQGAHADTVGSGDAFAAGFIKSYLAQEPLYSCLELGNRMGALVALQRGAICRIDLSQQLSPRELVATGPEMPQPVERALPR